MAETLEAAPSCIRQKAGHDQAFMFQTDLTRNLIHTHHQRKPNLNLLDYGCGRRGVQRVIFEGTKQDCDQLALFDPFADIFPPRTDNVSIVKRSEIFGDNRIPFDIVALSYVLCCVSPDEGKRILHALQLLQPQAQLLVVDYTLNNRSQMEVLDLLASQEEMKWRDSMGEEDFATTRRRFTRESLAQFIYDAGYKMADPAIPLDEFGIRAAIVTHTRQTDGSVK